MSIPNPSVRRRSVQSSRLHLRQWHLLRAANPSLADQRKTLDITGVCSGSTAYLRFQEWISIGVFLELWRVELERYDELKGLDWSWLSMDGAMTKSPQAGKTGANPNERSKRGVKPGLLTEAQSTASSGYVPGQRLRFAEVHRTLDEFDSPPTSAAEAKRFEPSKGRPVSKPGVG